MINEVLSYVDPVQGPIKFLNDLGYIKSPSQGKIKWRLFDFQEEFILKLIAYPRNLILKSRQLGISWCIAGFCLWCLLFLEGKSIYLISSNEDHAKSLLSKVRFIYENLPKEFRRIDPDNVRVLEILNPARGNEIRSLTSGQSSGRGESAWYVFFDEFAHIQHDQEIFNSLAFSTIHDGRICGVSTPNGHGNIFAQLWHDGRNDWTKTTFHYSRYPGYPYEQVTKMIGEMGKSIEQELECQFLQSGNPVFKYEELMECRELGKALDVDKLIKEMAMDLKNHPRFYNGVDVAEGGAQGDYTSITSLLITPTAIVQAGQYIDRTPISKMLGKDGILASWHANYPGPIIIEKNGPGIALLSGYQGEDVYPWQTTRFNKSALIEDVKFLVQKHQLALTDDETFNQLKVYQYLNNGSTSAPNGFNDDAVISLALALRAAKAMYQSDYSGYDLINSDAELKRNAYVNI